MKNIHKPRTPRIASLDLDNQIKTLYNTSLAHAKHSTWCQEELKALLPVLELKEMPLSLFKLASPIKSSRLRLNRSRNRSDKKIFHQLDVKEALKSSVAIPKPSEAFILKLGLSKLSEIDAANNKVFRKTLLCSPKSMRESKIKNTPTKLFSSKKIKKTKTMVSRQLITHKTRV